MENKKIRGDFCLFNFGKIENKRGQGLSTNAIILIVLGVVVLVILIAGFAIGWGKFAPFLSKNNVDTIVNSCSTACSTQGKFTYCSEPRDLNDGTKEIKGITCRELASIPEYSIYGVKSCPSIQCDEDTQEPPVSEEETNPEENSGESKQ